MLCAETINIYFYLFTFQSLSDRSSRRRLYQVGNTATPAVVKQLRLGVALRWVTIQVLMWMLQVKILLNPRSGETGPPEKEKNRCSVYCTMYIVQLYIIQCILYSVQHCCLRTMCRLQNVLYSVQWQKKAIKETIQQQQQLRTK